MKQLDLQVIQQARVGIAGGRPVCLGTVRLAELAELDSATLQRIHAPIGLRLDSTPPGGDRHGIDGGYPRGC